MRRMSATRMEIGHVIEKQKSQFPQYRALWASVIQTAIVDATDFAHPATQAEALEWLFGDSAYDKRDRAAVFGLLGLDVDACGGEMARRIVRRARAQSERRFLESKWGQRLRRIARKHFIA